MIGQSVSLLYFPEDRAPATEWTAEQLLSVASAKRSCVSVARTAAEIFVACASRCTATTAAS